MTRPTPMMRAPTPDLGTELIPKQRYTSDVYARLERERLWNRTWLLAGFERDVPESGDYLTYEIGTESILVVRQRGGAIAAHYNVCMHRGNRLREPGIGQATSFTCRFHGWRYGIDGSLKRAHDAQSFPQGCPKERLALRPVHCETWGGFVWINLNSNAEPLLDYLGVIPEHLDPYHFDEMSILNDYTIEMNCNWKTSLDAFNEAYHIAGTHPDTLPVNDDVNVPIDCYDRHSRMILRLAVASPRLSEHGHVNEMIRQSFLASAGIDPAAFAGGPDDVRPAIAKAVREIQGPALGADFSDLNDAQLTDDFHYTIFPNITLNIFGRSAWLFRHRPHPTDPNRMFFDFFNLLRAPSAQIPRAAHSDHVGSDDLVLEPVGGGGELMAQDIYNLPRIQAGMNSAAFQGLHLSDQEIRIRHFHRTLDDYIGQDEIGPDHIGQDKAVG